VLWGQPFGWPHTHFKGKKNLVSEPKFRDPLRDHLKAVNDQLAEREAVGAGTTPYLLEQKAELEAALGLTKPAAVVDVAAHVEPELERKDLEPAAETAVPRKPGRPRKVSDVDSAAGS
jgi:hypothetical protein